MVVRRQSSGGEGVPEGQALGVEAVEAQRRAQGGVVGAVADPAAGRAAVGAALVAVAGPAGAPLAAPLPAGVDRAKLGAVKVTNSRGCVPTEAGTPLPPSRPTRTSW